MYRVNLHTQDEIGFSDLSVIVIKKRMLGGKAKMRWQMAKAYNALHKPLLYSGQNSQSETHYLYMPSKAYITHFKRESINKRSALRTYVT